MNQSISPDQLKLMAAMVSEIMGTPVSLDHSPVDFFENGERLFRHFDS